MNVSAITLCVGVKNWIVKSLSTFEKKIPTKYHIIASKYFVLLYKNFNINDKFTIFSPVQKEYLHFILLNTKKEIPIKTTPNTPSKPPMINGLTNSVSIKYFSVTCWREAPNCDMKKMNTFSKVTSVNARKIDWGVYDDTNEKDN